jgi:paraquat-inducible protein A
MSRFVLSYRPLLAQWLLVSLMLVVGAFAPMFTFTTFWIFDDRFSLVSGIYRLLEQGEPLLFLLVFTFSILMPVYKMYLLYRLIHAKPADTRHMARYRKWLGVMGKWSMLDVFVVALLVVTVKLGAVADITIHYGLYVFAAAVVASMLLSQLVEVAASAAPDEAQH